MNPQTTITIEPPLKIIAMYYIQRKDGKQLETVDEFATRKEANEMRKEYCMSDPTARYYISKRACKDWRTN